MSYREQLKQFFAKTFKGWYIEVTRPKKFLLECGIPDLPIVIKPDTLKRKIEQHNLTKQDIACLNTSINSPLLVYDTTKEHLRGVAYNVIIWKNKEEDSLLCCTIYVNQEINIAVNNIASIHPRDIEQLTNWNHNGLLKKMCDIDKIKKVVIGSRFNCTKCNNFLLSLLDTAKVKKDSEKTSIDAKKLNGLDELELLELEAEALALILQLEENKGKEGNSSSNFYPERNGKITADVLKKTFAFRYVNVDINLDEKQEQDMLNISYDTFRLLARIIDKPMIAIGLGGNLTLNIGVRKMEFRIGGCYSPQYRALNFKSLDEYKHVAHEWFHALDHYLGYTYGAQVSDVTMNQSRRIHWKPLARNEIRKTWGEIHGCITRSDYMKHSQHVTNATGDDYWVSRTETIARAFEVWADAKMRMLGEVNNHLVSMFPNNPYPNFSNPKDKPISEAFDKLFDAFKMEKLYTHDIESLYGN